MKTSRLIFVLIIGFYFFNTVQAQSNSTAMKFDEFDDSSEVQFYSSEQIPVSKRIERFIKQIKRERGVKIYLIYYRARKTEGFRHHISSNWATDTFFEIQYKTKIKQEDIVTIDGGYKERNTIEYWIVPRNAEPPKPTPTFDKSESFFCPAVVIYSNALQFHKTKSIEFSVATYDLKSLENLNFNWKITSGKIVSGQGTDKIEAHLSDGDNERVTAFVEVNGLPYPCEKVGFLTIEVGKKPLLIDIATRYNYSSLSARIDNFMFLLRNEPSLRGYIIVYGSRKEGAKDMARAINSVNRMFAFRNYDMSRVTILQGGYREYYSVDIWALPDGAEPPKPAPTVDEKFVIPNNKTKKKVSKR